jgi:signal peptidase I
MTKKILKEIASWILVFVIAFAISQFVTKVIILEVEIPSGSMENTIMVGDRVIALRLAYLVSDPKRGDIIVFPFPDDEKKDYIKRIIGLPGDTIEGKDGYVYIDGSKLEESYVTSLLDSDFGPYVVPKDSYFMMGDNRNVSEDSRYWDNKYVLRSKIKGKAIIKFPHIRWLA